MPDGREWIEDGDLTSPAQLLTTCAAKDHHRDCTHPHATAPPRAPPASHTPTVRAPSVAWAAGAWKLLWTLYDTTRQAVSHMIPTIIIADRREYLFGPAVDAVPVAACPVLGVTLLEHTLGELADTDVSQVVLITPDTKALAPSVAAARTGLQVVVQHVAAARIGARVSALVRQWPGAVLIVRADILRSNVLAGFLSQARQGGVDAYATIGGVPAGIQLLTGTPRSSALEHTWTREMLTYGRAIECPFARLDTLETPEQYYQANIEAMANRYPQSRSPSGGGRAHAGADSSISDASVTAPGVVAGRCCHVHPTARLGLHTFLGDHTVVDRGARLEHVIILPHTYIEEGAVFRRAIVGPKAVFHLETGLVERHRAELPLEPSMSRTPDRRDDWLNRALAVVLLVALSPLWPLALLLSWRVRPLAPYATRRFLSNRLTIGNGGETHFDTFQLRLPRAHAPALSLMPWLWAAVRGHVRVVGAPPVGLADDPAPTAVPLRPWDEADDAPGGVFGPAWDATIRGVCDPAERAAVVTAYAQQRTAAIEVALLVDGLLSLARPASWKEPVALEPRDIESGIHSTAA